jgi:Uma2 family endonuclease
MPAVNTLAAIPPDIIWRLSVAQYHAMIQSGILTDDDPVELLEGWLVYKMPKNPPHRVTTKLVREALEQIVPKGWYVDSQEPITISDSEPEPDVVIVMGDTRQYLTRHPQPPEIALVVEVADTTLTRDRTTKKRTYARAQIPVYWIVNLVENQIEIYTRPSGAVEQPDYYHRQDYGMSDSVTVVIDEYQVGTIAVRDLLP